MPTSRERAERRARGRISPVKVRLDLEFVAAATETDQIPVLGLPEVALVGRSNVGKSSFINTLVGGRPVARTSRTPGRTRSINFYRMDRAVIVDLPGYGYAQVSKEERNRWKTVVESYLIRSEVKLALLIVDCRTGATESDQTMHTWLRSRGLAMLVAVTKVDKLGRQDARKAVAAVAGTLAIDPGDVVGFSAVTEEGAEALWTAILARLLAATVDAPFPGARSPAPPKPLR